MKEKLIFFMNNEEIEYVVEKKDNKFIGKTDFDSRLNCQANTLQEVHDIVLSRIQQLTKGN